MSQRRRTDKSSTTAAALEGHVIVDYGLKLGHPEMVA
jgi:hypothetical protein